MSIHIGAVPHADIRGIAGYLAQAAGASVARKFTGGLTRTLERLEAQPHSGSLPATPYLRFPELRYALVSGSPRHVVYYLPVPGGIRVARVLHGARDADAIFG